MVENITNIIIGGAIGFAFAMILNVYNDRRANERLERQIENSNERLDKQLSQSEKNLKMQLLHNDQKILLNEIYGLLRNDKFSAFNDVLNGFRGEILPEEFKRDVRGDFERYLSQTEKIEPDIPHPEDYMSEAEREDTEEQIQEAEEKLDPIEKREIQVSYMQGQMKASIETRIRKAMKKEY